MTPVVDVIPVPWKAFELDNTQTEEEPTVIELKEEHPEKACSPIKLHTGNSTLANEEQLLNADEPIDSQTGILTLERP
jgi:hypothetical protein